MKSLCPIKLTKYSRKSDGAMMSFMAAIIIVFSLVVSAFFYIAETVSGDKQVCNSADAGALAGAHQILSVGLTKNQLNLIPSLPPAFLSLGVNPDGSVNSNSDTAIFDIRAYNNCAAYTCSLVLASAADSSADLTSAKNAISALNQFASQLNQAITNSASSAWPGNAASNLITDNQAVLPVQLFSGSTSLIPESVQFGYYTNPESASNVYLSAATAKNLNQTWLSKIESSTKSSDGSSYLLKGNTLIDFTAITGVSGLGTIALSAMGPTVHLIAAPNFYTALPSSSSSASTNLAPYNSLQLQAMVGGQNNTNNNNGTNSGPIGSGGSASLSLSATSTAVVGAPSLSITGSTSSPPPATSTPTPAPTPCQPSPCQPSPCQPTPCQPSPCKPSPCQPTSCQPSPCQPQPTQCNPSPCQPTSCEPSQPAPSKCSPAPSKCTAASSGCR